MKFLSNKTIYIIESNTTGTGEIFLKLLLDNSKKVFFLSNDPEKYSYLENYFVTVLKIDTNNFSKVNDLVKKIGKPSYFFSSSESFIEICAKLNFEYQITSNSVKCVKLCRNKYKLYMALSSENIRYPKTNLLKSIDLSCNVILPAVVKPIKGTGSLNVKLVTTINELSILKNGDSSGNLLIQEYVNGPEYSVETLSHNGKHYILAIIKKSLGSLPNFIEVGHNFPNDLDFANEKMVSTLVTRALNTVEYEFGPAHTEIKFQNGIPYIIEINPRLAGGMIPVMLKKMSEQCIFKKTIISQICDSNEVKEMGLNIDIKPELHGAIRFGISNHIMKIKKISYLNDNNHIEYFELKKAGEFIGGFKDFRDRFLCIVGVGDVNISSECNTFLDGVKIEADVISIADDIDLNSTGRLQSNISKTISDILNNCEDNKSLKSELKHQIYIDIAHVLSLQKNGLITKNQSKQLIIEFNYLLNNGLEHVLSLPMPRGLYLTFEAYLIKKLGIKVAGSLQLGRSRNDINATLYQMELRDSCTNYLQKAYKLLETLFYQSKLGIHTSWPIYSQYQPAMPGTIGHYFLGIFEPVSDVIDSIENHLSTNLKCPLGSGAGGGTSIPLSTSFSSNLLGFKNKYENSLAGVADRSGGLLIVGDIVVISILLSRMIKDFQLWSTFEYSLIKFPDELCGGSSAMPQKRNPYILEYSQSLVSNIMAEQQKLLLSQFKTPFSNSYEVSSQSGISTRCLMDNATKLLKLVLIIIRDAKYSTCGINDWVKKTYSDSIFHAEQICTQTNTSFREAHHEIGNLISTSMDRREYDKNLKKRIINHKNFSSSSECAIYGGGASPSSVILQQEKFHNILCNLGKRIEDRVKEQNKCEMKIKNYLK